MRAGDCLVHLPLEHAHTLQAGDGGLDVLAFGQRHYAANTLLPRAGVSWLGPTWVLEGAEEDHPWDREAAVGAPERSPLADRPAPDRATWTTCERVARADRRHRRQRRERDLGRAAGSERTGIAHFVVEPGKLMNPPHAHSAEEELFVVLEGSGTLGLFRAPVRAGEIEELPVRAGRSIAPAGGDGRHASVPARMG